MNSALLNHFAANSSGIGALGFSGQAFLIQLVTFILAYLVLRHYAFGPILKMMKQRRDTIEGNVKLAEKLQAEQVEMEEKVEKLLHQARREADGIIAQAQDAGRQAIRDAEEKSRQKAANILSEAEAQIVQNTQRVRQKLEKELIGLIADTTEAIIEEKVDAKKDGQLIERALRERQVSR
ncbi:MAG TPA: F0F1 ATP synthase subunit B [Candidatus Saccharimonadales bacterium]|nr:F0F1 ATP synthase subunit B [Candidatus Saccharimonadales bacterium]